MPNASDPPIETAERTYAQALLELADAAGALDEIAAQARDLAVLLGENADLARLIGAWSLSAQRRQEMLNRLFDGRVHELLLRFLQVVSRKDRLRSLPGILRAFAAAVEEKQGRVRVDAYVAQPMDPAQAQRVESALGASLHREVVLQQHLEPPLIGGLKLRVGDQLLDGSIAAQLRLLRAKMIATGRERARAASEG